jgi:hypothetical protein
MALADLQFQICEAIKMRGDETDNAMMEMKQACFTGSPVCYKL